MSIPMADGVRLAASLYLPDGDGPWPAVLEALPYRKDDDTASYRPEYERLAAAATWCAAWTCEAPARREGVAEDEYPAVEQTDLLHGDRLARRRRTGPPGSVGMYGTCYTGSTRSSSRWNARRR